MEKSTKLIPTVVHVSCKGVLLPFDNALTQVTVPRTYAEKSQAPDGNIETGAEITPLFVVIFDFMLCC